MLKYGRVYYLTDELHLESSHVNILSLNFSIYGWSIFSSYWRKDFNYVYEQSN